MSLLQPVVVSRDRLRLRGASLVSDLDLLTLLVGEVDRARRLLEQFGNLPALLEAGVSELRSAGLSGAIASRLKAALELGRRAVDLPLERGDPIRTADDVDARLRGRLVVLPQEELHVLGLDTHGRVQLHFVAGVGTVNQVFVSPRDVFRPLVRESAHAAIVVHNHPSGFCQPSESDRLLTAQLVEAGASLGIPLVDHIVLAREGRYSFAENQEIVTGR